MKIFTQTHPTFIGTTHNNFAQNHVSTPFSAYQKPRSPRQKNYNQRAKKAKMGKNFTTEKDFTKINQTQQLLLIQELWLGETKQAILQVLFQKNIEVITFVHWLAVPFWGVVMSFSHQKCEKIEWL